MPELPSILMVFTGGTISMKIVPGRGALPAASGREILDQVPAIAAIATVTSEDFGSLPGPHWTPERMFELARHLDARLEDDALAAAVVTHGTDTLEETAYLLDLVLRNDKPVVLTGAMKTADDPHWDGPQNLLAAVRVANALRLSHRGVTVMFGRTLHTAREVTKSDTESFEAFTSTGGQPLGVLEADGLRLRGEPAPRERIVTDTIDPRVDLVAACVGADGRFIRHAAETGARGIVIAALGGGNVPQGMLAAVREVVASGVIVVIASRCGHGATAPLYGYEGGGVTLREAGAFFAGDLPAPKARIKLMLLLGASASAETVRASFERPWS